MADKQNQHVLLLDTASVLQVIFQLVQQYESRLVNHSSLINLQSWQCHVLDHANCNSVDLLSHTNNHQGRLEIVIEIIDKDWRS